MCHFFPHIFPGILFHDIILDMAIHMRLRHWRTFSHGGSNTINWTTKDADFHMLYQFYGGQHTHHMASFITTYYGIRILPYDTFYYSSLSADGLAWSANVWRDIQHYCERDVFCWNVTCLIQRADKCNILQYRTGADPRIEERGVASIMKIVVFHIRWESSRRGKCQISVTGKREGVRSKPRPPYPL